MRPYHRAMTTKLQCGFLWLLVPMIACKSDPLPPQSSPLIALTPQEYNNSVQVLLGLPNDGSQWPDAPEILERISPSSGERAGLFGIYNAGTPPWPWAFPEENGVNAFEGMADGQEPSAYRTEELQKAALHFASYTLVSPSFFTCDDWQDLSTTQQKQCGLNSLKRFANRAWRRPLNSEESLRLEEFWEANWASGQSDEAVVLTAAGLLQAPHFVFRVEHGDLDNGIEGQVPLTSWEMASKLSYFLWDSMPDDELFRAASADELADEEGIRIQVRRMLNHPKAREAIVRFHHQWLGTEDVHVIAPSRSAYGPMYGVDPTPNLDTTGDSDWPAVLGPVRHAMDAEFQLFVEHVVFEEQAGLAALLTDTTGFVTNVTEPIHEDTYTIVEGKSTVAWPYDVILNSNPASGTLRLTEVEYQSNRRAGIMTLPAVLAIGAYPVHPSPIHRGKRLLERVTCMELGAPPPNAEGAAPPDTSEAESTNRKRTEDATSPSTCVACHERLNPPGFAYEHYDALGRYRAEDNGLPVDASGDFQIQGGERFTFNDGLELAQQLAESPRVQQCYTLHWARYATGVYLDEDEDALLPILTAFQEDDSIQHLLESIATSELFRHLWTGGEE